MAIARKPQTKSETPAASVDVDALIAKGGSVSQTTTQDSTKDEYGAFTLRVPKKLLSQLDAHRKSKPLKTQRQYWILEAIVEKLEREV